MPPVSFCSDPQPIKKLKVETDDPDTGLGLCFSAWEEELSDDIDREFILDGIKNGFNIIDKDANPASAHCENHKSAQPGSPMYARASKQILHEIGMGNYEVVSQPPDIISPLGVIEKPDGGVRLIHDCSMPPGKAVNDYSTEEWHQKFARVDDAAALVTEGCFMAKVDIQSAYRHVPISKHSQKVTGLKWQFNGKTVYLRDKKLCFGSRMAPGIFHRLTQAVRRMLKRKGLNATVAYLDDFFIKGNTFQECLDALNLVISLLRKLGFHINWKKVVDPSTRIVFLGIEIDSVNMCMRLPNAKLDQIRTELSLFENRKRASKKQLQSLAGKLNFCASVVFGGRVFLRRIIDSINLLKGDNHKIKLTASIRADISWWQSFMSTFNGKSMLLDKQHIQSVFTDSCIQAAGGIFQGDWFYINWGIDWPAVSSLHINSKEILAAFLAVCRWAPYWSNKRIFIHSDNMTAVSAINKGTSRNPFVMKCLRQLFWLSATYNFHVSARFLAGISNTVADDISRLHEPGRLSRMLPYVRQVPFPPHMSQASFSSFFSQIPESGHYSQMHLTGRFHS